MSPILDIQRRLAQTGRIRIGSTVEGTNKQGKTYKRPAKLETFRLTSSSESAIIAVAKRYGGTPKIWEDAPTGKQWEVVTESSTLDILIPPERMSFDQYYELWSGGGCERRCNGAFQVPNEQDCVCDPENRECKPHTRLSVMLDGFDGAGLWRLDTQGYYAMAEMNGAFELATIISQARGTQLLPGVLRLDQREVKRPGEQTRKFAVPVIDFAIDLSAMARGLQPALETPQGLTPVPEHDEPRSFKEELQSVNTPTPKPSRANSAEPVRPTGVSPRARGVVAEDDDEPVTTGEKSDLATPEEVETLQQSLKELTPEEVPVAKARWKEEGIPFKLSDLTSAQVDRALQINAEVFRESVEKSSETPPDSPVSAPVVKPDEIIPPKITDAQKRAVNTLASNLGFGSRADVHARISTIIGVEIKSVNDLSKAQAIKVIDQFTEDYNNGVTERKFADDPFPR